MSLLKKRIIFLSIWPKSWGFLRVSKIRMIGVTDTGTSTGIARFRVFYKNGTKRNYQTTDLSVLDKLNELVEDVENWESR